MVSSDMMNEVRRASFKLFVAFLSVSALIAILTVLFGDFGDFEARVLATTSIIATVSICVLCCSAYSARSSKAWAGALGIVLTLISGGLWILALWADLRNDWFFRITAVLTVFAIGSAHALALLVVNLPPNRKWLQTGSTALILTLSSVISYMFLFDFDEDLMLKVVAILAILVALKSLLIPILGRGMKKSDEPVPRTLTLNRNADGTYSGPDGHIFRLIPVDGDESGEES